MEGLKILLVDDVDAMHKVMRSILQELGFKNIITAFDGKKAYDILTEEKVDLIISDWYMPNMSGIELLKKVRANESMADTPFLMVTAESEKENILAAVKARVNQYIIKPFNSQMLDQKIKAAVKCNPN